MPLADVFGLDEPFASFDSAHAGASAVLAVRVALFFFVVTLAPAPRTSVLAALGALFVASLAAQIFVLPSLLASLVAALMLLPRRLAAMAGAVALLGTLSALVPPRKPAPAEDTVAAWRARKNLWRARAAALEAVRHETPPGEAFITLAEVDHDLGRRDRARKVLEKVLTNSASPETARTKAAALDRSWSE